MIRIIICILSILAVTACAAIPTGQMQSYRSCDKPIKSVRMNLLKNGYELTADESEFLVTKMKSPHFGYGFGMSFVVDKKSDTTSEIVTKYNPHGRLMEVPQISSNGVLFRDVKKALCK